MLKRIARIGVCAGVLLTWCAAHVQAQVEGQVVPTTKAADLFRYVNCRVASGRILVTSIPQGVILTTETTEQSTGRSERLTLDLSDDVPELHYDLRTPDAEVRIELSDEGHLLVRRTGKDGRGRPLQFEQEPDADLGLTVDEGKDERVLRVPTLWHLFVLEPEVARNQLAPLLETLRPSWRLAARADSIETALLHWAQARHHVDRGRLAMLVEQLGSPHFAARRAAERELAAQGAVAVLYLASVRREDVDAEQWSRVRNLLAILGDEREDTVARVVAWLAGDPQIWLAFLDRPQEAQRRAGLDELQWLFNKPLEFDPAAAPDVRARQLARLRSELK